MTDLCLEQNHNSVLLKKYSEIPYTSVYDSEICNNQPNNFIKTEYINPTNPPFTTFQAGRKYIFPLGDNYFLKNMMIESTLTTTGDNTTVGDNRLGIYLFKRINVTQYGKILATITPSYILSRISALPENCANYYNTKVQGEPDIEFDDKTKTFQTPIFMWMIENERENLLLYFHRDLQLECELNDITFNGNITIISQLVVTRKCYERDFLNKYIEDVYPKQDGKRNYFIYNTFTLSNDVTNGTTETEIYITNPYLLHSLHASIYKNNTFETVNITKLALFIGQTKVNECKKVHTQLAQIDDLTSFYGMSGTNIQSTQIMYFGINKRMINGISGALDISRGPYRLVVSHDNPGDNNFRLYIDLEYYNIISSNNENGEFYGLEVH